MARFIFRAQVALDLRRKQDEEAQRELGRARQAVAHADAAVAAAVRDLEEGMAQARDEESRAPDAGRAIWYRNWKARQQQEIARLRQQAEERRAEERRSEVCAMEARKRLRSLERLRERAWRNYQREEARIEQREFDSFGTMQWLNARVSQG